ncbi:hypothetical protein F2Q65_08820 [Thiohalocapsa marina]|uniref:Outer membrane beta-barrel protein n=2 Tax=Thiohalocapsa marina TaxID=424902 RepID=A0A5M8FRG3_9GAMM|nr:hypothetical protein F2Q65_08820 [Thiohalocapsa marina]
MGVLLAAPAAAQDSGWSFAVSPYLWAPGIESAVETQWGTVGVDMSTSDVLSDLDLAFMGAFEARNGRWGLIADLFYAELSQSRANPLGPLFTRGRIETSAKALSGYAGYRVSEKERLAVDALVGFRVTDLELDLSLSPGVLPGQRLGVSGTWVDPVIGVRARVAIGENWFATTLADLGGFGGDSDQTWQVLAIVGYQLDARWSVQGGWRWFSAEHELEGLDVETDFSGPLLGLTARF